MTRICCKPLLILLIFMCADYSFSQVFFQKQYNADDSANKLIYANTWTVGAEVTELSALTGYATSPDISPNGLTIIFANAPNTTSETDLWIASRSYRSDTFAGAQKIAGSINTLSYEVQPSITGDNLEIFFVRTDNNSNSTTNVYHAVRTSPDGEYNSVSAITEINSDSADVYPYITPDGMTLYFTSDRSGSNQIYFATRSSRYGTFSTPQLLSGLEAGYNYYSYSLSPDGLHAYFCRQYATRTLCTMSRSSTSESFGNLKVLDSIPTVAFFAQPRITNDNKEIYFFQNVLGKQKIFRSTLNNSAELWKINDTILARRYLTAPEIEAIDLNNDTKLNIADTITHVIDYSR